MQDDAPRPTLVMIRKRQRFLRRKGDNSLCIGLFRASRPVKPEPEVADERR